jgi:hypothetical protein
MVLFNAEIVQKMAEVFNLDLELLLNFVAFDKVQGKVLFAYLPDKWEFLSQLREVLLVDRCMIGVTF